MVVDAGASVVQPVVGVNAFVGFVSTTVAGVDVVCAPRGVPSRPHRRRSRSARSWRRREPAVRGTYAADRQSQGHMAGTTEDEVVLLCVVSRLPGALVGAMTSDTETPAMMFYFPGRHSQPAVPWLSVWQQRRRATPNRTWCWCEPTCAGASPLVQCSDVEVSHRS